MEYALIVLLTFHSFCSQIVGEKITIQVTWKFVDVKDKFDPIKWINVSSNCYATDFYKNCYIKQFQQEMSNPRLDPFFLLRIPKGNCGTQCCVENELCCAQSGDSNKKPLVERKTEDFEWQCYKVGGLGVGPNLCCWPKDVPCFMINDCDGSYEAWTTVNPYPHLRPQEDREFMDAKMGVTEVIAVALFVIFMLVIIGCTFFHNREPSMKYFREKKEKRYF